MNLEPQITWHLAKYPQIKLSLLFGSFVRRQGGFGSDLDLTIAADWLLDTDEKMALIKGLTQLSFCPRDFADLQTTGGLVFQEILAKGVPMDDMDAHLYAELINEDAFSMKRILRCIGTALPRRGEKTGSAPDREEQWSHCVFAERL